jgi:hypothetical protein
MPTRQVMQAAAPVKTALGRRSWPHSRNAVAFSAYS